MKSTFRETTADDCARLTEFLAKSFNTTAAAPSLHPALMAWKYWELREDWREPRSYVLERDNRIIAHAGLCPLVFSGSPPVRGVHMIDWAGAQDSPGAGLLIVQKLAAMFDFIFAIGGSEMTRKVLPAFGFIETAEAWTAALPLRPLRQIFTHQHRNWKLAARLARNLAWSKSRGAKLPSGWKVVAIAPSEIIATSRTPEFFQYFLRCPTARFSLHGVMNESGLQGHFVIGVVRGQARVAGVWLREPSQGNWRIAYTLARRTAMKLGDAFELAARGTKGPSAIAAAESGLRLIDSAPVYLLNKKSNFTFPGDFQFQFADDDEAFLDTGSATYYT